MVSGRSPLMRLAPAALALAAVLPTAAGAGDSNLTYKERTLPPYAIRVETHVHGSFGTYSWTETYGRVQMKLRSDAKYRDAFYFSESQPHANLPRVIPGTLVASADFTGGHGYPPGRCEWKTSDHLPAGLDVDASETTADGADLFVLVAYPLYKSRAQLKEKCGGWIFGATASDAKLDGMPQEPSASVTIANGASGLCVACNPFSNSLRIEFIKRHRLMPLHFPMSRMVAGKSFGLKFSFSTSDNPPSTGSLRITFTRVR